MEQITSKTKNTKSIRLEIYKAVLEYFIKFRPFNGICNIITIIVLGDVKNASAIDDTNNTNFETYYDLQKNFPELAKYEPKTYSMFWFPLNDRGTQQRIDVLKQIVADLEK